MRLCTYVTVLRNSLLFSATFAAVLKNHPTRLFPESDKDEYVYPSVQLRLYKIKSVKRRIADLIEKSLENVSKEELQQLAKLVEAEAALDANDCKFDVWDTVSVDRFLSCLQMAVPLFARGAPSMLVDCVLKLPDFDKLSDERKFDFLRALAEISSHTTAPVAQQLLPLVAELSKTYISQTERGDSKSFAYVECVLYLLLHLSHKAPDVATQTCSKEFMWRFKSLKSRTWERMKILAKTLSQDDIDVLDAEKKVGRHIIVMETKFRAEAKRQSTKTEIRSCINILAIRKLLKKRKFCFVKLSWKEARNASKPSKTYRNKIYQRAPYRSAELESISKDCSSELAQYGKCDLSYKQVQRLVGSKKFQEFSSDRKGPFVLNDTCGTAMLGWHMEESALSFLKECGEEGRSGKVRNQMYHLTCAMYVGSDLVSSERHLRKLEKKEQGEKKKQGEMRKQGENTKGEKKKQCQPLCPWNLCIFCDPSKLGKDKRAKEDKRNRLHHCYGAEIENVLSHIQANGASREIVSDFLCTDYLPPTADDPSMKRRKNIKLRRLHSLKEVVKELKKHTVGADLINYSGLMRGDKEVYEACMDPESVFVSYHAVVIEKIQKMGDDWVAVCKMSNGRYLGRDGYCNVSLTTKYIPIGVSDVQGDLIRGSEKPMHLLTNFIIVEIIEDEEENWNSDDEEDAKDDKKPSEENPKEKQKEPEKKRKEPEEKRKDREEKKYTPKKFRSSGNTPSDQLTQVTESDAVDVIEDAITRHNSNSTTELTALVARFPSISEYVALNMLMKAITFDDQAVQRHSVTVLECVKDPDASVRKRALELVTLLVNENNVTQLTKELIDYLEISDEDFKEDLSAKICFIVEKFSPEKLWYIDQMLKVLCEAGKFVKDDVWHALIVVISNASELHGYTVRALYRAVLTYSEQETLVRVAVWCIGEYGDLLVNNVGMIGSEDPITVTESDAVDVIEDAITRHNSDSTTKAMALVALLKLSSRFPSISERIKDIIVKQKGSLLLEMQQRAIEYNSIVDRHKNIRSSLVERMPVLDEATFNVRRAGSFPASASTGAKASVSLPNGFEKPAVAPLVDLLDLDSDDILAAPSSSGADYLQDLLGVDLGSSSSQFGATQAPKAGTDLLLDILSIGTPSPAQNSISSIDLLSIADANSNPSNALDTLSSPVPPHTATTASTRMFDLLDGLSPSPSKEATNGPAYPSIVAYESSSLKIEFTFSKPPGNPQTTNVQATFINLSPNTFTDFIFQAAVPKFLQLHLDPASSNTLPASGNGAITQNLKVTNSQHGKKSLVMRMRIGYKLNEKDVLEEGQVSNFPRGL